MSQLGGVGMIGPLRFLRRKRKATKAPLFPVRSLAEDMAYCMENIGLTDPDVPFEIEVTIEPTIRIVYEGVVVTWRPEITRA